MSNVRLTYTEDKFDDCITITDNTDKLKNGFGSDIILYPAEDGWCRMISDEEHEQNIISLLNNLKGYSSDDMLKEYYLFELAYARGEIPEKKYQNTRKRAFGKGGLIWFVVETAYIDIMNSVICLMRLQY